MNWISTLTADDIQVMKLKLKFASDKQKIDFANQEYTVDYIDAVVKVWETNIVGPELLDEDELGNPPSFEDTINLVKEQQKEEK